MGVGTIFKKYGHLWMADKIVQEENRDFKWIVVTAMWSEFGPQPIWPKEPRRFIFNRTRKSDGLTYC